MVDDGDPSALDLHASPHAEAERWGWSVSPVTLMGVGTRVVVALSSKIEVKRTLRVAGALGHEAGLPGPYGSGVKAVM